METKACGSCRQELSVSAFNKNAASKDGLHRDCRSCKKIYQARWYENHREDQRKRVLKSKRELRQTARAIVIEAKKVPCVDCGKHYPWYVMDLDHLPEYIKLSNVSQLVVRGVSLKRLWDEIAKCEVVCANCHRERTFNTRIIS